MSTKHEHYFRFSHQEKSLPGSSTNYDIDVSVCCTCGAVARFPTELSIQRATTEVA